VTASCGAAVRHVGNQALKQLADWEISRPGRLLFKTSTNRAAWTPMSAEEFVGLIEEMIELKIQQETEAHMKPTPEIARVLAAKRETDRRRLDQIRAELVRILAGSG
jgi:hypothetical protein